jgi:hypothetical protein
VQWPKEGKEFASARAAVGTQNGVISALIKAGLLIRSGTGVHVRYTSRTEKAKQALIDAIDGDGRLMKLALWPSQTAGGLDPTVEEEAPKTAAAEPEPTVVSVSSEQRRAQVDALVLQQYASALPEIIRILSSLDAGVKSSISGTDRILTAIDRQKQASDLESSSFNALKETVQGARDAQMKVVREIGAHVDGIAASIAKAAAAVPLAALIEQLKLSYDQALHSAEICDLVKTRVEGLLSKPGGERG